MSLNDELADDAPKIHLVLEADEGRAAWKPAHPVNRRRARRLQNRVGDKRVERPDGIDVHHRDVGPVSAESGEPRLHDSHDVPRLLTHRLGGCLPGAHDPLDADAALAHFARAGHDERGPWRRARDRIGERVERGLGRAITGVERIEALEAERRRASELDGAQRGVRSTFRAEMAVEWSPRGSRFRTYHFPPSILLTLSDEQLLMPAQSGCRPTLSGEDPMFPYRSMRFVCGLIAATLVVALSLVSDAPAQGKKLKIGVIYDYTGPFAGGGSELHALGAKIMIDYFIKKGGVEGYQIEAIYADAQSKPDIAINEAVRLVEQEKVDMLLGFYSSAQCVPVAARVEQLRKFMWITTCISSAVLENRNLKYVFRIQPSGRQFGLMSTDFVAQNAKAKLGKEPKALRVAIIHEDGAYGVDVSKGNEEGAKKAGFTIVLKEGYAATAPDLSSLVTKLKRGRPDVIFHTGYNPDITLFLRQAREQGLRFSALIGHGAGYGVYD